MIYDYHKDGLEPEHGEIFVFGSNLAGRHGAGAARVAMLNHGAKYGVGFGRVGHSYALPTKDEDICTLPISEIKKYVDVFIEEADAVIGSGETYFVTRIGCGLAGYTDDQIAPLFVNKSPGNVSFPEEWATYLEGPR